MNIKGENLSNALFLKTIVIGVLFFSSIAFAQSQPLHEFTYNIKYLGKAFPNCFDIRVGIKGNNEGKYLLRVSPYFDGITFKENVSYTPSENRQYLIHSESMTDLNATYKVCMSNPSRNNLHPIIEKNFFHFMAESLLILPSAPIDELIKIKIKFEGFPQEYAFVTNHHVNKSEYEVTDTLRNISRSIMAGGRFRIETMYVNDKPIHIVLYGKWSVFKNDEMKNNLLKIIGKQREFLKDDNFPYFVMIIYDNDLPKPAMLSGQLYENVLSMLVMDGEEKSKPILYGSFSHELFHAWIGNKIKLREPQGDLQWFFEGVNDFYGWQLALEAGQLSEKQYIKYFNEVIRDYSLSPYKTDSNNVLFRDFKLSNPAARLAMSRGHIVFMEIFNKLKNQQRGREPIDAALREIVDKYSDTKNTVTRESLDHIFRKHVGDQIWNEALRVLYNGEAVSFSQKPFSNRITLSNLAVTAPDFGFNVKSLVKDKRIVSLKKNSNAALAGLKENDKVLEYGFNLASATSPAQIVIEESGQQKLIEFMPQETEKVIPQYISIHFF